MIGKILFMIALAIAFAVALVWYISSNSGGGKNKENGKKGNDKKQKIKKIGSSGVTSSNLRPADDPRIDPFEEDTSRDILSPDRLADQLAPDGIDPNKMDHLVIWDAGHGVYIRSFYIESVPKTIVFADTFATLFNFPGVTSTVFEEAMMDGKAERLLDKKIISDEAEVIGAQNAGNSNRKRKMMQILARDEEWASQIETGKNSIYYIGFLFSLVADSLEQLNAKTMLFISAGKERSLEICSCYGMQAEAYLSNSPCNRVNAGALGLLNSLPIKFHPFDKYGVATLFNHTNTFFSHPEGVPIGRNLLTGEPILFDPYAKSHNGYSAVFVGAVGTGKSCTIKILASRLEPFGYRFACIDTEKSGGRGEYARLCDTLGGINFQLKARSSNKLNIFEVDEQLEIDHKLGKETPRLHLLDKIADVRNILMTAIVGTKEMPDFSLATSMESILSECIRKLYESKGIIDEKPATLFTDETDFEGNRIKKDLPTMSDMYMWILRRQRDNKNEYHALAYQMLVDSLSDMVDDLTFDGDTLQPISQEAYVAAVAAGKNVKRVRGARGYFDGQSTMHVTRNTPFINIDLSDLPKEDKLIGQQVAMNYLIENFIKKNSENVRNAQKIVLIIDEAHRMFPYKASRRFLVDQVRTARKNNASMWICTQAYRDFSFTDEKDNNSETILKNVSSVFMLKQSGLDRDYLLKHPALTPSMVSKIISLGGDPNDIEDKSHKGEVCLIDNDSKVIFLKVDYLKETEAYFAETDVAIQKQQLEQMFDEQYA
jgi:hypothetical protein